MVQFVGEFIKINIKFFYFSFVIAEDINFIARQLTCQFNIYPLLPIANETWSGFKNTFACIFSESISMLVILAGVNDRWIKAGYCWSS